MDIIDTHCHVSPVWFEPVETLLFHMDRHSVKHAVLTQLLGQSDNGYQKECVERYPGRFVSVVAVDGAAPDAAQRLRELAAGGARGLRLRPDARATGADPLALWRTAADLELTVSSVGPVAAFLAPPFQEVLETFPRLDVLAEHLGGWARPDCDGSAATLEGIKALARHPRFHLTLDLGPARVVLELLPIYGAERLCWASDFPVVSSREGYANALTWSLELLAGISQQEREQIFAGTARRLFRIE